MPDTHGVSTHRWAGPIDSSGLLLSCYSQVRHLYHRNVYRRIEARGDATEAPAGALQPMRNMHSRTIGRPPQLAAWVCVPVYRLSLVALVLLALLSLAPLSAAAQSRPERVMIIELENEREVDTWRFEPPTITIPTGSRVVWTNSGRSYHTVTSPEGLFDSGYLKTGERWATDFDTPGVYNYFCVAHTWMKGTLVVRPTDSQSTIQATP